MLNYQRVTTLPGRMATKRTGKISAVAGDKLKFNMQVTHVRSIDQFPSDLKLAFHT